MFIFSMRAGTVRFFAIVGVALIALVTLIAFVPELSPANATPTMTEGENETQTLNFEKVKSNEDRIAFLAQFGWEVDPQAKESSTVTIPREFDKVFAQYNELQRSQGLDLSQYAARTVERYTYLVKNYPDFDGEVLANLLIYRGKVIGGDICSADSGGFLHGFQK